MSHLPPDPDPDVRGGRRERAGGRVVLFVLSGVILLFGVAYAAAYVVADGRVPRGTTVADVEIGDRSRGAAEQALRDGLTERLDRDLMITEGSTTRAVPPADLGLRVDVAASVRAAGGGRSWRPQRLWDYFSGGRDLPAVVSVDDEVMRTRLKRLDRRAGRAPVDATVTFVDGRVQTTAPQSGSTIDPAAARPLLERALLDADDSTIELPTVAVSPDIDQADLDQAVESFATPAVAAPLTLTLGETPVLLQPRDYSTALSMHAEDGALVPDVDPDALAALVVGAVGSPGAPVDASVSLVRGRPTVTKAQPGVSVDPAAVAAAFTPVLTAPDGQRVAAVDSTVAEPAFSTRDARALKIREKVSEFTTYFPYADYRNTNIGRAAELVDGTVLKPGDTFSYNGIVGERTRENGFVDGFVINDGIFSEDLGGGVSQLATTTYNAAFFAGLEDVEHQPHSFYIDRYPVGREATVAWGSIDLRFRDDTPYGVLVSARVTPSTPTSQGVVTVSMWSTKTWDIQATTGERYHPTRPAKRTLDTPDCYPNTGYGGFDIDVTRTFRRPGSAAVEKQETDTTTYTPSDTVVCTPAPTSAEGG